MRRGGLLTPCACAAPLLLQGPQHIGMRRARPPSVEVLTDSVVPTSLPLLFWKRFLCFQGHTDSLTVVSQFCSEQGELES